MITDELISYIKKQTESNLPKNFIISKLLGVGWRQEDIDEAFGFIEKKPLVNDTPIIKTVDNTESISTITTPKIEVKNDPISTQPEVKEIELVKPTILNLNKNLIKENVDNKVQNQDYEFIPNLIPKDSTIYSPLENTIQKDNITPKDALLGSYYKDMASVEMAGSIKSINKKSYKKWIVFAILVLVVLGTAYAFVSGTISLKNINFSFVKKDPRVLLLSNSETLSSLKSYKTETNIDITFPTVANISNALASGEEVSSIDKDSININSLGLINKTDETFKSDNFLTIKSSLLSNTISTDIKSDSNGMYVSLPDIGLVTGVDNLGAMVVKTNDENSHLIANIFPENTSNKLSKLNLYRILSKSVSSYIDADTFGLYNQFINDSTIVEKEEDNIKGVDTYHYNLDTNKQITKKLLTRVFENFTNNLSDEDKIDMETIISSTKISSFDVWIGKTDNNIYQYKVVLGIPLSKILKFDDKSIGDNIVNINWQTTYYDFDINNEIVIPEQSTDITEFLTIINEVRLKKEISLIKDYATILKNIEGSYGVSANSSGSCLKPAWGSLFSPTGHPKKAIDSISSISSFMNKTLTTTNGQGACYSTTKSWSFTIPMSDDYSQTDVAPVSFYCIDSTGVSKDLQAYPKGPICQ